MLDFSTDALHSTGAEGISPFEGNQKLQKKLETVTMLLCVIVFIKRSYKEVTMGSHFTAQGLLVDVSLPPAPGEHVF